MLSEGSALYNLTDSDRGFGDVYVHFILDIYSVDTCFKTTDIYDWMVNCENRKPKNGVNCETTRTIEAFCLSAKMGMLLCKKTNKVK